MNNKVKYRPFVKHTLTHNLDVSQLYDTQQRDDTSGTITLHVMYLVRSSGVTACVFRPMRKLREIAKFRP